MAPIQWVARACAPGWDSVRLLRLPWSWTSPGPDLVRLKFDNSGDSENVGRTRRTGWDLEAAVHPVSALSAWGAYTRQRARIVEPGATQAHLRGHTLHHVPEWNAKAGLDWSASSRLRLSAWWQAQGDNHLTNENALSRYGGHSLVHADAQLRIGKARVGLGVRNLFDRDWDGTAWFDGVTTLHAPGDRRTASLSLGYEF